MNVQYRICNNSYTKNRLPFATKEFCLKNCIDVFNGHNITVYGDNLNAETEQMVLSHVPTIKYVKISEGSSAQSFRCVFNTVLRDVTDNETCCFIEDDYLWRKLAPIVIEEGLARSEYITPYLHLDKFIPAKLGGNPEVDDAGSTICRVFKTEHSFFMTCNSTTMTFASKIKTLKEDADIWNKHTVGEYPTDYQAFLELRDKGRTVAQCIPTCATHAETAWLAPLIGTGLNSWENLIEENKI